MMLKNYFYYFKAALPDSFCNAVLKAAEPESHNHNYGLIAGVTDNSRIKHFTKLDKKAQKELFKQRKSKVTWLNEPWIKNEINKYVEQANIAAGWNYIINEVENAQFTTYDVKEYYEWHNDCFTEPFENGNVRKLSVTVSLTDPKKYQGGDLEFDFKDQAPGKKSTVVCSEIKPRGSIVVFPSFVWHRVKPVTKGTRQSLVMWYGGPSFV